MWEVMPYGHMIVSEVHTSVQSLSVVIGNMQMVGQGRKKIQATCMCFVEEHLPKLPVSMAEIVYAVEDRFVTVGSPSCCRMSF